MTECVPNSAGFLIDPYSLSVILGDLEGLIWRAPIIEVVIMDCSFSSSTQSGNLELHENLGSRSVRPKVIVSLFLLLSR